MRTPPKKVKTESDVQLARGRLRGALNESLNNHDTEDEDMASGNDDDNELLPQRGRPNKEQAQRNRRQQMSPIKIHLAPLKKNKLKTQRHNERQTAAATVTNATAVTKPPETFVMKLFDRSLDLSRYTEKTPLYPICRAWMANQPRNPNMHNYQTRTPSPVKREDNGNELLEKLQNGTITEVHAMPIPKKTDISKIPMPLMKKGKTQDKESEKSKNIEEMQDATREELLALNMKTWKLTKQNWLKHTKEYNKRYETNFKILEELFKG